jgi:hypothetical protein
MKMMSLIRIMVSVGIMGVAHEGLSHARLQGLAMRNNNDGNKEPVKPCGPGNRNLNPTRFNPGQKITVNWEETIDHVSRYEFYFSEKNDSNFVKLLTVQDSKDGGSMPHRYSAEIQLPNISCASCTLQMIQVMLDNPANPTNYYSCADVQLGNASSQTANASPAPQASAVPTNTTQSQTQNCN